MVFGERVRPNISDKNNNNKQTNANSDHKIMPLSYTYLIHSVKPTYKLETAQSQTPGQNWPEKPHNAVTDRAETIPL